MFAAGLAASTCKKNEEQVAMGPSAVTCSQKFATKEYVGSLSEDIGSSL
jgi:hypothetical protein